MTSISPPVGVASEATLRAAMARLLAGRPARTDGRLTVANLAREAGVGRATANRATEILDAFRVAVIAKRRASDTAAAKAEPSDAAQVQELRVTVRTMAQQIQALALRVAAQDRVIAALHAERAAGPRSAMVIPVNTAGRRG